MSSCITKTLDASASGVTDWIDLRNAFRATIQIVVPTGPNGAFTIEGTNDIITVVDEKNRGITPSVAPAVDITDQAELDGSLTASGTAASAMLFLNPPGCVRVKYARTSGSGIVKIHVVGC